MEFINSTRENAGVYLAQRCKHYNSEQMQLVFWVSYRLVVG